MKLYLLFQLLGLLIIALLPSAIAYGSKQRYLISIVISNVIVAIPIIGISVVMHLAPGQDSTQLRELLQRPAPFGPLPWHWLLSGLFWLAWFVILIGACETKAREVKWE
jgi:hypothetical protein